MIDFQSKSYKRACFSKSNFIRFSRYRVNASCKKIFYIFIKNSSECIFLPSNLQRKPRSYLYSLIILELKNLDWIGLAHSRLHSLTHAALKNSVYQRGMKTQCSGLVFLLLLSSGECLEKGACESAVKLLYGGRKKKENKTQQPTLL